MVWFTDVCNHRALRGPSTRGGHLAGRRGISYSFVEDYQMTGKEIDVVMEMYPPIDPDKDKRVLNMDPSSEWGEHAMYELSTCRHTRLFGIINTQNVPWIQVPYYWFAQYVAYYFIDDPKGDASIPLDTTLELRPKSLVGYPRSLASFTRRYRYD